MVGRGLRGIISGSLYPEFTLPSSQGLIVIRGSRTLTIPTAPRSQVASLNVHDFHGGWGSSTCGSTPPFQSASVHTGRQSQNAICLFNMHFLHAQRPDAYSARVEYGSCHFWMS